MKFKGLVLAPLLLASSFAFAHPFPSVPLENQRKVAEYIDAEREAWLDADYAVLNRTPRADGDGWTLVQKKKGGKLFRIFKRENPQTGDSIFYYWDDLIIDIPLYVSKQMYASWIDLGANFLSSIKATKQLFETPNGNRIWYQYFDTGIPLASTRILVSTCVMGELEGGTPTVLISCRSIPPKLSGINSGKSYAIRWRAAYLLREDPLTKNTLVRKIDEENEGGLVCSTVLDMAMPKYLNEEVTSTLKYIQAHREELIARGTAE